MSSFHILVQPLHPLPASGQISLGSRYLTVQFIKLESNIIAKRVVLKPVLRFRIRIQILNRKIIYFISYTFPSFLNFLFRIFFVKIQIVSFNSQFFLTFFGFNFKNINFYYHITYLPVFNFFYLFEFFFVAFY